MSQQEEKAGESGRETKQSMLKSLWRKVSGGKAEKKDQAPGAGEEDVPEVMAQEEASAPEPPFEETGAPEELIEYYQQYCQERGEIDHRYAVKDFCDGPLPEEKLLKQVFSQIGSKAAAAMGGFRRQERLAALKEEQRRRDQAQAGGEAEESAPAPPPEDIPVPSVDGQMVVFSALDLSAAWGMVLPPLGNGTAVTYQSACSLLGERKISYGIDVDMVQRLTSPEGACLFVRLAACKPAVPGEDGRTEEHFPRTVGTPQLVENARGIVNFDDLNWLIHIDAGTVICDIIEPTMGKPGTDIQGKTIPPYNGKKAPLPKGDGVVLNREGTALVAKTDGQISFRDGRFFVHDVIVIKGNVDASTGSLDVVGDLVVHGNVQAGFTIRATGNITIGGLVGGSRVTAGGSIVVNKGMNGNTTGKLTAGKDVFCKYMENASVEAEGEVRMDSIVNSDISAKGKVVVKTGRGVIIGGAIRSLGGIEAKTIGNMSGRSTTLIIGPTRKLLADRAALLEKLEKVQQQSGQLGPAVIQLKERPIKEALEELDRQEDAAAGKQIVAGELLPMAQVTIGGLNKNIIDHYSPCRIYFDAKEGTIRVINV